MSSPCPSGRDSRTSAGKEARPDARKGRNGVSTNGVTANIWCFLTEELSGVNLLLSSQKCQCLPLFPQSVYTHYFCDGPISVDPTCPQPSLGDKTSYAADRACCLVAWSLGQMQPSRATKSGSLPREWAVCMLASRWPEHEARYYRCLWNNQSFSASSKKLLRKGSSSNCRNWSCKTAEKTALQPLIWCFWS